MLSPSNAAQRGPSGEALHADNADIVAQAELKSVKEGRSVYEKRTPNIFFLSSKETALTNASKRIVAASENKPQPPKK